MLTRFPHFSSQLHHLPNPPPAEDEIPPVGSVGDASREHVEGSQGVLLLRLKVVDLVSQLVGDSLMEEGREQEILHGIQSS